MEKKEILVLAFSTVVFILGALYLSNQMAKISCYQSYSEYKTDYGFYSGCRIMWNDKLTPVEIIREIK